MNARSEHDPLYCGYVLLLCLGLCRGEILGLRWGDIDLATATVHVHRELKRVGGRLVLSETKTLDSDAALPLPPMCVVALRDHLAQSKVAVSEFVISTRSGGPVDPRNFYRSFQRRVAQAGVPWIQLHGIRHTCATLLVELDVHPRVAMQILRHAKIATTMDIYSHVPTSATRRAVHDLAEHLDHSIGGLADTNRRGWDSVGTRPIHERGGSGDSVGALGEGPRNAPPTPAARIT